MALALTDLRVWDGHADSLSEPGWTLRIEDGRIVDLGSDPHLSEGARVISLPGQVAVPGLIDAHIHISLNPQEGDPLKQEQVPQAARAKAMEERAAAMLRAGITTARDLGGAAGLELALRDRILAGDCLGPRLICAGQPVTTPGGHCHFWGGEASSVEAIHEVIDRQIERGSDWIKVMATGGVFTKGTKPWKPQFAPSELQAVVDRARGHGREVAAHCHGTLGIEHAVEAGVRTIEHCSFAGEKGFGTDFDARVVERIVAKGAWVSPTVNQGWGRRIEKDGKPTEFFARMSRTLSELSAAGTRFVASTDAGIPGVPHDRLARGLAAFERYSGLSPVEVLRTATSGAAEALGIAAETGSLHAGLSADVMVVPGDPLADLSLLERPSVVIARGEEVPGAARGSDERSG
jgi:imidazolonepropionase-like amidohydrolase